MGRTSNHVSFKTCILKCHGCEYNKARIVTQEDPVIDKQWTLKLYLFNLYWRCMYEEIFVIIFLLCANTRCIIVYGPNTHWRSLIIFLMASFYGYWVCKNHDIFSLSTAGWGFLVVVLVMTKNNVSMGNNNCRSGNTTFTPNRKHTSTCSKSW